MSQQRSLIDRLRACADQWAAAHDATPARLGRLVANDSSFFARLDASASASTTTATLERFVRFLADVGNWSDGSIPQEVSDLAHACGVSASGPVPSAGKAAAVSHEARAVA